MDRTQSHMPTLQLDPKRIAGTSVAVAIHLCVLMMLMLPAQLPSAPAQVEEPEMALEFKTPPPPIVKLAPRPPLARPVATPQRQPEPQVIAVDTTPSPVDVYVEPSLPKPRVETYQPSETQPFAQISADVSPAPPYPPQALRRRLAGVVVLRVQVDATGRPVEVTVESSSGTRMLDEAARKFVQARWHFIPARQNGVAIEALALVPIEFVIDR